MYYHHKVTTLDDLIEKIKIKVNNPNYDSLYQKTLENFLKNDIKNKYENMPVVATFLLVEKYNRKGSNKISEENQFYYKNREFANLFEKMLRLMTKSKIYSLISIEYYNGYPILIVGEPDGLSFEGNMNNKANIFEVKSFNLTDFIQSVKELNYHILIKKVLDRIKTNSSQLMLYRYLLEKTQKFGLIGEIDKINLYGKIYFYSEYIEYLHWAIKTIEQDFNIIKRYAIEYNVYNLSLKDAGTIDINNKNIYYFKIHSRIEYNQKIVENYLKNLDELF